MRHRSTTATQALTLVVALSAAGVVAQGRAGALPAQPAGAAAALASGTWTASAGGPLPAGSDQATAWAGHRLVVWGGSTPSATGVLGTGATYDPTAGKWQKMSASPLAPRTYVSAARVGNDVLLWGGEGKVGGHWADFADGAVYDPGTNKWHLLPPAPLPPERDADAIAVGKQVVIFGGYSDGKSALVVNGATYDVATGKWARLPELPAQAPGSPVSATAAWTGHQLLAVVTYEKVVITGKGCKEPCTVTETESSSTEVVAWAPGWQAWHVVVVRPQKDLTGVFTYQAQAVWAGDELLLVGGSFCLPGMSCPALGPEGYAASFNPHTLAWHPLPGNVGYQSDWAWCWTGHSLVALYLSSVAEPAPLKVKAGAGFAFDPVAARWTAVPRAPVRGLATASVTWTGRQLVVLGTDAAGQYRTEVLTPG